jgi:hypothetical protein
VQSWALPVYTVSCKRSVDCGNTCIVIWRRRCSGLMLMRLKTAMLTLAWLNIGRGQAA